MSKLKIHLITNVFIVQVEQNSTILYIHRCELLFFSKLKSGTLISFFIIPKQEKKHFIYTIEPNCPIHYRVKKDIPSFNIIRT